MPTEGGLHVPFIICGPDPHVPASSVRDDLVNLLDLSATTLHWAGIEIPRWHEGQNLFAEKLVPRNEVFAKDRLDHTIDRVRSVRSSRYRYTRNFKTDRILLQPQYRDSKDYVINSPQLYSSGKLSELLKDIYFGERPAEEFYDVQADPSQLNNLLKLIQLIKKNLNVIDSYLMSGSQKVTQELQKNLWMSCDIKRTDINGEKE